MRVQHKHLKWNGSCKRRLTDEIRMKSAAVDGFESKLRCWKSEANEDETSSRFEDFLETIIEFQRLWSLQFLEYLNLHSSIPHLI